MLFAPTTHIMKIAQAILFRGAGFTIIWPSLAAIAALGALAFFLALRRMRIAVTPDAAVRGRMMRAHGVAIGLWSSFPPRRRPRRNA
jgi:hypothetical protein